MKTQLYIVKREQGDYAIRKPGSERASAIMPTSALAVRRAHEIDPSAAIYVERVRDTSVGGRDRWRRVYCPRKKAAIIRTPMPSLEQFRIKLGISKRRAAKIDAARKAGV